MQRRRFLAGTGATGLAALVGCSGILGDGSAAGSDAEPFARWAPARDPNPDRTYNYEIGALQPSAVLAASDEITPADLSPGVPHESVAWDALAASDVERVIDLSAGGAASPRTVAIFDGDVDPATIVSALDERPNYDREHLGDYRGYEIHGTGAGFFFHAVRDGRVLEVDRYAYSEADRELVESVIDLGEGDGDRLLDSHDGFATAATRLDATHWTSVRLEDPDRETDVEQGRFRGVVATGASATVADGGSTVRALLAFRDVDARRSAPIEPYVDQIRAEDTVESVDFASEGRILDVTLRLDYPAPFVSG
ncbi:hypothetical protein L593_09490 [Salinarchaeum sp. Harcht-Bsk1]|uniref:hypothetical protein n=1 Tax=Salinarchaeum sp. Harcht-Bsk1 TaxID=1333523 RepID=UPI00034233B2|nr:hypothetical protein [Salinarchaeum sp. Harcht-Bsk1]AGN01843.1 hypothetical protein L593_09490 [Salinarchaeum sp. Harcht-Bsk1]